MHLLNFLVLYLATIFPLNSQPASATMIFFSGYHRQRRPAKWRKSSSMFMDFLEVLGNGFLPKTCQKYPLVNVYITYCFMGKPTK